MVFAIALLRSEGRFTAVAIVMREKESAYSEEARNILPLVRITMSFGTTNQAWGVKSQRGPGH